MRTLLIVPMLLVPLIAQAEVTVSTVTVRSGFYRAPDCTPTAEPEVYNECVCQANIRKPQVSGLAPDVVTSINSALAQLPEKLAEESCEGTPTGAPVGGLKVNLASSDYEVTYQTPTVLTVLTKYSTYGTGSEHALEGTEGQTFELVHGQVVDPVAGLKPAQLKKIDGVIKQELLKKYPTELFEETKARTEPFLNENGCDSCTIFYGKAGWMVRFQVFSIAPYALGEPEIALPADLLPAPDKLIVKG
ncbi:MAG: hypothetical protein ACOYNL_08030 [Rickettsiales bacterium]